MLILIGMNVTINPEPKEIHLTVDPHYQSNLFLFNLKVQNQLKSAQSQAQARQNQIQQIQRELQQAKEALQQNLTNQKELQQTHQSSQQSHNEEVNNLKTALAQAESKVRSLFSLFSLSVLTYIYTYIYLQCILIFR